MITMYVPPSMTLVEVIEICTRKSKLYKRLNRTVRNGQFFSGADAAKLKILLANFILKAPGSWQNGPSGVMIELFYNNWQGQIYPSIGYTVGHPEYPTREFQYHEEQKTIPEIWRIDSKGKPLEVFEEEM